MITATQAPSTIFSNAVKQHIGVGNLMNWGVHNIVISYNNGNPAIFKQDGWVGRFTCKVSGWNYKQPVYLKITLNTIDLYDVELIRANVRTYKVLKTASNVYADQLGSIIQKWLNGGQ